MSQTLTTTKKIPLYHIEEEPDWIGIVERIITNNSDDLDYRYIDDTFENVISLLAREKGPGILLWDLRLGQHFSEYQTVLGLIQELPSFQDKCFSVFILSGYLHDNARSRLLSAGIPDEHIFEKGRNFSRNDFIENLKLAEEQLRPCIKGPKDEVTISPAVTKFENNQADICELTVRLVGFEEDEEPLKLINGKTYSLRVSITSLPDIVDFPDLIGKRLDLNCFCPGSRIESAQTSITIPPLGKKISKTIKVVFDYESKNIHRSIYLMAYHQNHLLQSVFFSIKVL